MVLLPRDTERPVLEKADQRVGSLSSHSKITVIAVSLVSLVYLFFFVFFLHSKLPAHSLIYFSQSTSLFLYKGQKLLKSLALPGKW